MPINTAQVKTAVAAAKQVYEDGIAAMGSDCAFKLRTGETFTIRGVLRHQAEQSATDGINQDRRRLTVAADRWDAAAPPGRMPNKGDQVTIDGQRYGVMEADAVNMADLRIHYRIHLTG